MTGMVCGDNRFKLIEKYKNKLIESTNIETTKDEMAVIDSILFRFWQMGWLDKLEDFDRQKAEIECLQNKLSVLQFKNSDLLRDHKELNIQLESMRSAANSYKMHYEEALAEIERLQKIIVGFMDEIGTWSNKYDVDISNIHKLPLLAKEDLNIRNKIKSEVIKEFAERLKDEFVQGIRVYNGYASVKDILRNIDNLVKEMEGGTDE